MFKGFYLTNKEISLSGFIGMVKSLFVFTLISLMLTSCISNGKKKEDFATTLKPTSYKAEEDKKKTEREKAKKDRYDSYEKYSRKYQKQEKDTFEIFNRKMYFLGDKIDKYIITNVVKGYRVITNKPVRNSIHNFFVNLRTPVYAINSTLQGNGKQAVNNISSFGINTTVGGLGLFDVANSKWGIKRKQEDFGQTLGRYGVPSGPYLFLPLLGPSSVRDFPGKVVDRFVDPITNIRDEGLLDNSGSVSTAITVGKAFTQRDRMQEAIINVRKTSFDPYATIRSAYLQKRQKDVKDRE